MNQEKVGAFIGELRREKGMTQEELGERMGVTNKTVSRWETAKYMPDVDKLLELSEILGVSVTELLSGERIKNPEEALKKSDENILTVLSESETFGLSDRIAYFKHRWLKANLIKIIIITSIWILSVVCFWIFMRPVCIPIASASGITLYLIIRNKKMIYVEKHAYKEKAGKN